VSSLKALQKSQKFYLNSVSGKKIRHERWTYLSSDRNYLFFHFEKQFITLRLTRDTVVLVNKQKKGNPIKIQMMFGRKKDRKMSIYIYNSALISMTPNHNVPIGGPTWIDHEGELLVTLEDLQKEIEKLDPETKLFHFLLNDSIYWGLGEVIVSETLGRLGYDDQTTLKNLDLDKLYPIIKRLLLQCFYLDGRKLNMDGEYGEFHRCLKIYGKKKYRDTPIVKKRVKVERPISLYFLKKKVSSD